MSGFTVNIPYFRVFKRDSKVNHRFMNKSKTVSLNKSVGFKFESFIGEKGHRNKLHLSANDTAVNKSNR